MVRTARERLVGGAPRSLTRAATDLLDETGPAEPRRRPSSVTVAGVGVGFESVPTPKSDDNLRTVLSTVGDVLAEHGTGLLITIDEFQSGDVDEIRRFGAVLQHVSRREQRPVAFIALPQIEETLLSDDARSCSAARATTSTGRHRRTDQRPFGASTRQPSTAPSPQPPDTVHGSTVGRRRPCITEAKRRLGRMVIDLEHALGRGDDSSSLTGRGDSDLTISPTVSASPPLRRRLQAPAPARRHDPPRGISLAHHAARDWLRQLTADRRLVANPSA